MSYPIGPFTLTLGQTTPIPLGAGAAPTNTGTVVLFNLSGWECLIQVGSVGASGGWLVAHTGDRYDVPPNWDGTLTATPQALASNAANAPSFVIVGRVYAPGEAVTGTYPVALSRLANVGNSVGTVSQGSSAIQTGETPPNYLVRSAPAGYVSDTLDLIDTGEVHVRGLSNSAETDFVTIVPSASLAATVQFHGVADQVPAAGVQTGALPSGVTVPAGNISGAVGTATNAVQGSGATFATDHLTHAGADWMHTDGSSVFADHPLRYSGVSPAGAFLISNPFSGNGAGTFSHGLPVTPRYVGITSNVSNSTETVGVDSIGSSTVHVNQGVGGWNWIGLATG